jgi:hypothetical protein
MQARLGLGGSCPFAKPADPAKLEELRQRSAASLRGASLSPARPALGFALETATKEDVRAWGTRAGATCSDDLAGAAIRCENAAMEDGARAADAFFRFDPRGRLVAVDVMREPLTADAASALFEKLVAARGRELGAPSARHGSASPETLASGRLMRADAEFHFADYAADVSVTNFGEDGIVVREQYRSLR